MSHLKQITSFKPSYAPSIITKWRSSRTGLQLLLVEQERATVEGYFAVATEIEDDSGCPHTLEHLIFMGSKKHPYKGLLDTLGNRAFSNTNAWTATDSTVYTLTTAGWEGFRLLLPVYLDHLINPTLTDSACYTEVYHIDGDANEKGVVFSEMQAVENEAEEIAGLRARKILYPASSGYSSETGGLMGALRVLTNDRIRQFYHALYRPDNLCIIVVGTVEKNELIETIAKFDDELPTLDEANPSHRPFVDTESVPVLVNRVIESVEFPDKDESSGHVLISLLGPSILDEVTNTALHCLFMYLTDSDVSLFRKAFVEIENPLCTEILSYTDDFKNVGYNLWFQNVPTEKLENLPGQIFKVLLDHVERSEFDLRQMQDVIERERLQFTLSAERYPSTFANVGIQDFLYGSIDGKDLHTAKQLTEYEAIREYGIQDWESLIRKWVLNPAHVLILARPSAKLASDIRKDAKLQLTKRRQELGKEGLQKLASRLKIAQDENETKIPDELLFSFPAPDPAKVKFIQSVTAKAGLALNEGTVKNEIQDIISKDNGEKFPLYLQVEHVKSNFASISIIVSTLPVPQDLLPYLSLFLQNFFSTPIVLDDGIEISYEEVVKQLKRDTISDQYSSGFEGEFEELLTFELQFVPGNYKQAIDWFQKLIWHVKFDVKRLQVAVDKALLAIPSLKRDGSVVTGSALRRLLFTPRSAKRALDDLENEQVWRQLGTDLKNRPEFVIDRLVSVRDHLFAAGNLRILVTADVHQISNPVSSWHAIVKSATGASSSSSSALLAALTPVPRSSVNVNKGLSGTAYLLTVPSTESSFATLVAHGFTDFKHADIPALAVATAYLEAVEGPFWRGIRGNGYAYGANLSRSIESGMNQFRVYRGADVSKAISKAKQIVNDYGDGKIEFEPLLIDSAISTIVGALAEADNSYYAAASRKYLQESIKLLGANSTGKFLASIRTVTGSQLQAVANKYLKPLFDHQTATVFLACNPVKINELKQEFVQLGFNVVIDPFGVIEDDGNESGSGSEEEEEEEDDDDDDGSEESYDEYSDDD
ncbi:Metalloenzyme, LuxS/M16 peptidase-like protein [Lipomyces japonicus]|uniref:Metalloenzyme, LuxS/M16 peptidase-like protein n=1 Tax=Lipomyces japonicus TaxID=56871 RepID=UPI0034CD2CE6